MKKKEVYMTRSVRVSTELYQKVMAIAADEDRSFGNLARVALTRLVKERESGRRDD